MPTPPSSHVVWLVAVTPETQAAIGGRLEILLTKFPFKVGREERLNPVARLQSTIERRIGGLPPTNDLYLQETGKSHYVSRLHFEIDWFDGKYHVEDRNSTLGTIVAGRALGLKTKVMSAPITSTELIVVGGSNSPVVFRFEVREDNEAA
jgi:hypothetical protein